MWGGEYWFGLEAGCGKENWASATCHGATGAHLHRLWLCLVCSCASSEILVCTCVCFSFFCVYACKFFGLCLCLVKRWVSVQHASRFPPLLQSAAYVSWPAPCMASPLALSSAHPAAFLARSVISLASRSFRSGSVWFDIQNRMRGQGRSSVQQKYLSKQASCLMCNISLNENMCLRTAVKSGRKYFRYEDWSSKIIMALLLSLYALKEVGLSFKKKRKKAY